MKPVIYHSAPYRRGVLTFEWMLVFVLLVIGLVGGVAVMRDTIISKFASASGALGALDMSYQVSAPIDENKKKLATEMGFTSTPTSVTVLTNTTTDTGKATLYTKDYFKNLGD